MGLMDTATGMFNSAKDTISGIFGGGTGKPTTISDLFGASGSGGAGISFDEMKGRIKTSSYPIDLMSNGSTYNGAYMLFFISTVESAKPEKSMTTELFGGLSAYDFKADAPALSTASAVGGQLNRAASVASSVMNKPMSVADIAGAVAGGGAGLAAFGAAKTAASGLLGSTVASIGGAGVGTAVALGVNDAVTSSLKNGRTLRELNMVIALPMPDGSPRVGYNVTWAEDSFKMSSTVANAVENIPNVKNAIANKNISGAMNSQTKSSIAAMALSTPGVGEVAQLATGMAPNPKKELMFKDVAFRNWSFTYTMYPRNKDEARNILNIVHRFKYHMHPEIKEGSGDFLYIYPSEFDIQFMAGNQRNAALPTIATCVLTSMDVTYSPGTDQYTVLNDATFQGMPVGISLTVTFRELTTLDKRAIDKCGY